MRWYWLNRVVQEEGPLNECTSGYMHSKQHTEPDNNFMSKLAYMSF